MKDENHDENQSVKVRDHRRFNPDGSIRENEEADSGFEEPSPETKTSASEAKPNQESEGVQDTEPAQEPVRDFEGAEIPAEFSTLILTLTSSAQSALGVAPDPVSGKVQTNLSQAKHLIDLLGMLEVKTQGNLSQEEARLLQAVLSDLRMRFVEAKKNQ